MGTLADHERRSLADLLERLGPDRPTMCGGWTTGDLLAHLLLRERHLPASLGIRVAPLARFTERTQQRLRPYGPQEWAVAVDRLRQGPPAWSPYSWPVARRVMNTAEMFVHHEDVRRAQPGWKPRDLPDPVDDALWRIATTWGRVSMRRAPCGVALQRTDGAPSTTVVVRRAEPVVTVRGPAQEVLLHVFGRRSVARVDLDGVPEAVRALEGAAISA